MFPKHHQGLVSACLYRDQIKAGLQRASEHVRAHRLSTESRDHLCHLFKQHEATGDIGPACTTCAYVCGCGCVGEDGVGAEGRKRLKSGGGDMLVAQELSKGIMLATRE